MTCNARSRAWLRIAVIYFTVAVALGIQMGASGDHSLMAVHAHLNLLGWVSMSLFGLIGLAHPAITEGPLASCQFWFHNIGVPMMLVALAARIKGVEAAEPFVGLASVVVGLGVLLFAWMVLARLAPRSGGG